MRKQIKVGVCIDCKHYRQKSHKNIKGLGKCRIMEVWVAPDTMFTDQGCFEPKIKQSDID